MPADPRPQDRRSAEDVLIEARAEEARANRLLSVGAVARELHVSRGTVRNWIKDGKLAAERLFDGGWWYVRASDLRAIEQKAQKTQSAR